MDKEKQRWRRLVSAKLASAEDSARPLPDDTVAILWADQRIQELEEAQRWIPVSERLPEPSGEKYGDYQDSKPVALLLNNGEWCKGHFVHSSIGGAWCSHYSPSVNEMVTHWQPLLPAPEGGERD